jgi:hypothetical protein
MELKIKMEIQMELKIKLEIKQVEVCRAAAVTRKKK